MVGLLPSRTRPHARVYLAPILGAAVAVVLVAPWGRYFPLGNNIAVHLFFVAIVAVAFLTSRGKLALIRQAAGASNSRATAILRQLGRTMHAR